MKKSLLINLLLIVCLVLTAGVPASQTPDRWKNHPALESYKLGGQQLPAELYFVRTRSPLPQVTGITVHGEYEHVYLVSGDRDLVFSLTKLGFGVYPLKPLADTTPAIPRSPGPQWEPVATPNPVIAEMVSQVNWTDVSARIQWLCDFGTRYSYAPNHISVANQIADVFRGYGLPTAVRSFVYNGTTMYNVIATHTGTVNPGQLFVICGHFDSVSEDPYNSAPGADDNGTGTAAVLTAAEILSQYQFEYSVRFICFGGEEQGLLGSEAYAEMASNAGMDILGVLNFDMMGYWEPGIEKDLEIETNVASRWLANIIVNCANVYTDAGYQLHINDRAWWGDHASFWTYGYAAVNHEESYDWYDPDFNPYYHTTDDLLTHVGEDFTVDNIQVGVAALATLAGPIPEVTEPTTTPKENTAAWIGTNYSAPSTVVRVGGLAGEIRARVGVYDVRGRHVTEVLVPIQNGGGQFFWDGSNGSGTRAPSGVYFFRLEDFPAVSAAKFVFVK